MPESDHVFSLAEPAVFGTMVTNHRDNRLLPTAQSTTPLPKTVRFHLRLGGKSLEQNRRRSEVHPSEFYPCEKYIPPLGARLWRLAL